MDISHQFISNPMFFVLLDFYRSHRILTQGFSMYINPSGRISCTTLPAPLRILHEIADGILNCPSNLLHPVKAQR